MRTNIVHIGADELTYEIREIVEVGEKLESLGVKMLWENIGDPVAKGHSVPAWIKEIIMKTVSDDEKSFGYSPTKGLLETRKFIAKQRSGEGVSITADDILFFNGLGDAISIIYTYLNRGARVIGPNPAYPTHSSAEGAHAGSHHITYNLNPHRNWLPDLEDLRNKVKYNPSIAGILIINPDNPTGMVYPRRVLEEIVAIAKEFDLFLVSDEVYANIVYGGERMVPLYKVIEDVPAIIMRGLSKEIPWPGARCGWVEFYNKDKDHVFARYAKSLVDAKQLEVCSTTLPQNVLPKIFSDKRYRGYLKERAGYYKKRADVAYNTLKKVSGVIAPKPDGAFYMAVVFEDGVLKKGQTLNIENKEAEKFIDGVVGGLSPDKRFAYYLMASTGICVVPLSGFNSDLHGFRITLLESDEKKFKKIVETIAEKIKEYINL
ncbi:MAG TPA: pyridoxal phosphate-dependent aminotransferase [Candidatus Yonathbacteria bacterium]|nr:pyridoxal phosphate-dependent aminotransferase [Candidatus Yonathbacteria bacterium]